MIRSFRCRGLQKLAQDQAVWRFSTIERNAAEAGGAGQHRETAGLAGIARQTVGSLRGDRARQHTIRINDRRRIGFRWIDGDAGDEEIVDYRRARPRG